MEISCPECYSLFVQPSALSFDGYVLRFHFQLDEAHIGNWVSHSTFEAFFERVATCNLHRCPQAAQKAAHDHEKPVLILLI